MAFALNALATGQAAAGSPTSGTFTATASGNIYVFVCLTGSLAGEAAPTSITCTDGSQGAFALVYSQVATALSQVTVAVYRSVTSGSPVAGSTITANVNAGNTDCELIVAEVPSGMDTTTPTAGIPTVPVKGATTTPQSVTLSATPTAADIVVGVGASRNRLSASPLTAGTAASFSIVAGLHLERAAAPSASIAVEKVTGYTGTTVDMGNFNTVYSDLNAFILKAASSTPKTLSETGTGTDAVTVAPAVPIADTGTGVDAITVAPAVPLTEAPHGTDALSATATVPLTDTATGVDALSANATVALTESSTGVDAIAITATVALTETGTGVEAIGVGIPQVLPGETGTGVDAISITTTVPLTDTSTGADALTLTATVPLSDPRPVTDALTLTATVPLADARPAASDVIVVAPAVPLTDTSTGADALAASATVTLTESSTAVDSISINTGSTPVSLTESVAAVDSISHISTQDSYQFVSPLFTNDRAGTDRFWGHLTVTHSKSILKIGSTYVPVQGPTNEQIVAADITYLGGHIYTVSAAEAAALTAAGYGAGLS